MWPLIIGESGEGPCEIFFAYPSFKWKNSAAHNAGVTVSIIGLAEKGSVKEKTLFEVVQGKAEDQLKSQKVSNINAYLLAADNSIIAARSRPISQMVSAVGGLISFGNKPTDGGNLLLSFEEKEELISQTRGAARKLIHPFLGSEELIQGRERYCLWVKPEDAAEAQAIPELAERFEKVRQFRLKSPKKSTRELAGEPWRFGEIRQPENVEAVIWIAKTSSESRAWLPAGLLAAETKSPDSSFAIYNRPIFWLTLLVSRAFRLWAGVVCGKLETRIRFSNTLGWNNFPVPTLTKENMAELAAFAERILFIRERYWPATIAEMYDPEKMAHDYPDLLRAHQENDALVEEILFGVHPKSEEDLLSRLFCLYERMLKDSRSSAVASFSA